MARPDQGDPRRPSDPSHPWRRLAPRGLAARSPPWHRLARPGLAARSPPWHRLARPGLAARSHPYCPSLQPRPRDRSDPAAPEVPFGRGTLAAREVPSGRGTLAVRGRRSRQRQSSARHGGSGRWSPPRATRPSGAQRRSGSLATTQAGQPVRRAAQREYQRHDTNHVTPGVHQNRARHKSPPEIVDAATLSRLNHDKRTGPRCTPIQRHDVIWANADAFISGESGVPTGRALSERPRRTSAETAHSRSRELGSVDRDSLAAAMIDKAAAPPSWPLRRKAAALTSRRGALLCSRDEHFRRIAARPAPRGFRDRQVADGRREVDPIRSVALAARSREVGAPTEMLLTMAEQVSDDRGAPPDYQGGARWSSPIARGVVLAVARAARTRALSCAAWCAMGGGRRIARPAALTLLRNRSPRRSSTNAASGGLAPSPEGRRRRANKPPSPAQHRL